MARTHHRKKHKSHVRRYKHAYETPSDVSVKGKTSATLIFSILGGLAGLAIGYFGSQGAVIWMIAGLLSGAAAGYFTGKKIDKE